MTREHFGWGVAIIAGPQHTTTTTTTYVCFKYVYMLPINLLGFNRFSKSQEQRQRIFSKDLARQCLTPKQLQQFESHAVNSEVQKELGVEAQDVAALARTQTVVSLRLFPFVRAPLFHNFVRLHPPQRRAEVQTMSKPLMFENA